jgi:hypothetical protein
MHGTLLEADRVIQEHRLRLEELVQSLEPPETRQMVHPIDSEREDSY